MSEKLSKHFSRAEFRCRCLHCGLDTVDVKLILLLEQVREHFKEPVTILSGFRCFTHNEEVGGVYNSQHLYGRAADIFVKNVEPIEVYNFLNKFNRMVSLGLYKESRFVHIDTRTKGGVRWIAEK